ncbi:MAG: Maf family protein [Lachnospiraceae bacterium]|nr:Maf family protein [Lachnospiraceae bacterium]
MSSTKEIILASASPRRQELLRQIGINFMVIVSDSEEEYSSNDPEKAAEEISFGKARNVAEKCDSGVIVAADTIVVVDGRILGKPEDEKEAFKMLKELQGRSHKVITGVTLARFEKNEIRYNSFHETTEVEIYPMTDVEILDYISTGDPMDKAGSYGIQGVFAKFIKKIDGDYYNVVGLPLGRLYHELNT